MYLRHFELIGMRNLEPVRLDLGAGVNVFHGANGSGKTSVLEGIYFLGRAHTFRSRRPEEYIRHGDSQTQAFGVLVGEHGVETRVGISKRRSGQAKLRVNGERVENAGVLVRALPIVLLSPDSHRLVNGSPGERRRFLDWGVFHVEHGSLSIWQRYARGLSQRNTALRLGEPAVRVTAWDADLVAAGESLHRLRESYLSRIQRFVTAYAARLGLGKELRLEYEPGWPAGRTLGEALQERLLRDVRAGVTQCGPHRAELLLWCNAVRAQTVLSRGEEKILVAALILAQASCMSENTGSPPVVLLDDLGAELDAAHRDILLSGVADLGSQVLLTGTSLAEALPQGVPHARMFHVEQGQVQQMV